MKLADKRDIIKKAEDLLAGGANPMQLKDAILRLVAGWSNDLINSPEIKEEQKKFNTNKLIETMHKLTLDDAKDYLAELTLSMNEVMASGMLLHNAVNDEDTDESGISEKVFSHIEVLEKIFDMNNKKPDMVIGDDPMTIEDDEEETVDNG